jgi:hypothetical protein
MDFVRSVQLVARALDQVACLRPSSIDSARSTFGLLADGAMLCLPSPVPRRRLFDAVAFAGVGACWNAELAWQSHDE